MAARNILILGGTRGARLLADRLVALGHTVTTSLAGRTQAPALPQGGLRLGGFGGADGLAAYLKTQAIELLVDATHPFAAIMSRHAVEAAAATDIALIRLERPAWTPEPGDRWIDMPDIASAAAALPAGAAALVTVGRQEIAPFLSRADTRLILRMIEPPDVSLPVHATLLLARPPFALESELALMRSEAITHLVAKNSGGEATYEKIAAARALGLQVVMIARPTLPPARTAVTVDEAVALVG